jgi:CheY-like chemotaxis protein
VGTTVGHSSFLLKALYTKSRDSVLLVDESGNILQSNDEASQLLDGSTLTEWLTTDSMADLLQFLQLGSAESGRAQLRNKENAIFQVEVFPAEMGFRVVRLIGVEDPLFPSVELSRLQRLATLGQLSSEIAHGISNPLAVIQGRIELLLVRHGSVDKGITRQLQIMQEQCQRLVQLLQSLQSLSLRKLPRVQEIMLSDFFTELVQSLRSRMGARTCQVHCRVDRFSSDPFLLGVVFRNLLSKLLELSSAGKKLEINVTSSEGFLRVQLTLDGFKPSRRLVGAFQKIQSSGDILGSSLGHEFILATMLLSEMGGDLVFEEDLSGSVPVVASFPLNETRTIRRVHTLDTEMRIMVVDDHSFLRETLSAMLAEAGHKMVAASSAEEALKLIGGNLLDVIVIDYRLPGMNGEELLLQIEQNHPSLRSRCLVISGIQYVPPKGTPFLSKPFTSHKLLEIINQLAQRKG